MIQPMMFPGIFYPSFHCVSYPLGILGVAEDACFFNVSAGYSCFVLNFCFAATSNNAASPSVPTALHYYFQPLMTQFN